MGWSGGSRLADKLWRIVREYIPIEDRPGVAQAFIDAFEQYDCDTLYETENLMADAGKENDDD